MTPIRLSIVGIPQPKGSMQVLPRRKFPFFVRSFKDLLTSVIVTSDNPHPLKAWEKAVREAAEMAAIGRAPFEGPIELTAVFSFERPKSVKREFPSVRPDGSKLLRGIEDPLSGLIYIDDAQIVASHVYKRYATVPGVEITIQPAVGDSLFDRKDLT